MAGVDEHDKDTRRKSFGSFYFKWKLGVVNKYLNQVVHIFSRVV
jgi:hypothetical protein